MPAVKRWIARSGRWRGPYTVKYRRQAIRIPYKCANACATSSAARLLAAYGEIGVTAAASSTKGAGVVAPYTDEEEATTTGAIPARRAASSTRDRPVPFASREAARASTHGRTPA